MKKPNKNNQPKTCPRCGKAKPVQVGVHFNLRANAAIVNLRCPACGSPVIQFRDMTSDEQKAEAQRILREDEQRKAEEAAKAARRAKEEADWQNELATIKRRQGGVFARG